MSTIDIRELQKQTCDVVRSVEAGPSSAVMIDGQLVARALPQDAGVLVRGNSGRIPRNFSRQALTCGSNTCTITSCP